MILSRILKSVIQRSFGNGSGWQAGVFGLMLGIATPLLAQDEPNAQQLQFFETRIRPVLVTECYRCHSQQTGKIEGSLRVDNAQSLRLGGDSGPAIDLQDYSAGTLWQAINHDGIEMPPGRKLPPQVIADFETWLQQGAPDPRTMELDRAPSTVTEADIEQGRQFWSLQPVRKPEIPEWDLAASSAPIDRLLAASWQAHQISPPGDAAPETVLRRLCFDLLGVPPTSDQIDWFRELWDQDQDQAVATAVDRMLASPKFGERWGRHWLDIARYAESTGKEINAAYPHAWRYRDYVIDALNADKPYDQFLKEQLAGDLLPVDSDKEWTENLIATGFLALGPKTLIERSQRQFQADLVDEQIDVTTRSILGISVACARCHDHKFEAITQRDYYALAGIFSNMDTFFGGAASRRNRHATRMIELPVQEPHSDDFQFSPDQIARLKEQIRAVNEEIAEVNRPQRDRRSAAMESDGSDVNQAAINQQQRRQMIIRLTATRTSLQNVLDSLDDEGRPLSVCMGVQPVANPADARLLARGEVDQPGERVPRGLVSLLAAEPMRIAPDSSGRLEFANWIASDENPLTARVMANRIWSHLLGKGIVSTTEDFGVTGAPPTHPELLDYLAARLVEQDWSIKSLIREIATSRAYRMSSEYREAAAQVDPENQWLWRRDPRQLEAEAIRDAMLMASGELDTSRPHGSVVATVGPGEAGRRSQFAEIMARLNPAADRDSLSRQERLALMRRLAGQRSRMALSDDLINQPQTFRSIYLPVVRDHVPRALELFDFAEPSMVVGQRDQSQTAPQALFLMNNEFVWQQSVLLADSARDQFSNQEQQVNWLFRTCFSRDATEQELQLAQDFLESQPESTTQVASRNRRQSDQEEFTSDSLALFCQALFVSAEFRFVY